MKKILFFGLMALLIGGFTTTATAQNKKDVARTQTVKKGENKAQAVKDEKAAKPAAGQVGVVKEEKAETKPQSTTNWDVEIGNFEKCIDKASTLKNQKDWKAFDQTIEAAHEIRAKIDASRDQLNRTQAARFDKNVKMLKKLEQAAQEGREKVGVKKNAAKAEVKTDVKKTIKK